VLIGLRSGDLHNIGTKSISKIHNAEKRREQKINTMEAFQNSLTTKNTRRLYKRGIDKFAEWYGKTIDEILAERKDDLTPSQKRI